MAVGPTRRAPCLSTAPTATAGSRRRGGPLGPEPMADTEEHSWWRREGSPEKGFRYVSVSGKPLRSTSALARIQAMAIPPAWTDVHISPFRDRAIQAWGYDAAGRRQYIYSEAHREERDRRKWDRLLELARLLPRLREVTNADLKRPEPDLSKVAATVVRLMTRGFFRVGGERYAEENNSYGIVTLEKRHLTLEGNDLVFDYKGKRQIDQRRVVADTPLVEIVRELLELPGERLFQYRKPDGDVCALTSRDVNEYLQSILGEGFTSKDLRTFGGTVRAATILADMGPATSTTQARKNVLMACRMVASELGNTPSICRSSYIHPAVFERYEAGGHTMEALMRKELRPLPAEAPVEYYPEEGALMRFLERYG